MNMLIAVVAVASVSAAQVDVRKPSELLGTWRGTSTCTDRVAAPACNDEVVVYVFTPGAKPGVVHWQADKVVNGQRQDMGEFDLVYDAGAKCWSAGFGSPVRFVWCVAVDGDHLTGTGTQLPGKQITRRLDARKQ